MRYGVAVSSDLFLIAKRAEDDEQLLFSLQASNSHS